MRLHSLHLIPLLCLLGCGPGEPLAGPAAEPPLLMAGGLPGGPKCVSVELTPDQGALSIGGILQMTAAAFNKKESALPDAVIQWQSSVPAVAAVSASGLVTGVAAGQTHILASCAGIVDSSLIVVGP